MKKKSLSISDFQDISRDKNDPAKKVQKINTSNLHSVFLKPESSLLINSNITHNLKTNPIKAKITNIFPAPFRRKPSEDTRQVKPSISPLENRIDSLDKCRDVFDEIIKRNEVFGETLSKIKDFYEKELSKSDPYKKLKSIKKGGKIRDDRTDYSLLNKTK